MSAVQRRLYAHMQRSGVILTDGIDKGSSGSATGAKALNNTVMQLRKICNHPFLFEAFESSFARHLQLPGGIVNNVDLWRASGKFELLDRVLFKLLSRRHRCLIFSQFVSLLTVCIFHPQFSVVHIFRSLKIFWFPETSNTWFSMVCNFYWLHCFPNNQSGSKKSEDRAEYLEKFNAPNSEYDVFLLRYVRYYLGD